MGRFSLYGKTAHLFATSKCKVFFPYNTPDKKAFIRGIIPYLLLTYITKEIG